MAVIKSTTDNVSFFLMMRPRSINFKFTLSVMGSFRAVRLGYRSIVIFYR